MKLRTRLFAVFAAAALGGTGLALIPAAPAAALAPTRILNDGVQNSGNTQWMETQSVVDSGSVRTYVATFLVEHAAGRRITTALADLDWASDIDANTSVAIAENQFYGLGTTNFLETSRVTVSFTVSPPNVDGRNNFSIRFRLVDDIGGSTQTVSANLHVVDASNGSFPFFDFGAEDYPRLTAASQSPATAEVIPLTNVTYNFTCDDVDFAGQQDCDRANIRWRRLDDGTTGGTFLKTGINDNTGTSHTMSFPSQGYYVVEAQLGNEGGGFPDTNNTSEGWWRLGNAVVNEPSSTLSGSLSFSGVAPSSPPSVNPGAAVTATATVGDSGGQVQVIEWDADGSGSFERREYTVPLVSGGNLVHDPLTPGERQQSVNTSTAGLKTVNARITDNGALDAADNVRRQLPFSGQLLVNAVPTALNFGTSTNEDTPKTITMVGNDPDNQPAPLVYTIVSPPPASAGTLSAVSGNQVTFTPASNFNGSTSFTYRVADGPAPNNGAFATSTTATVNITVNAVNDLPTVDPKSATTNEDTPVNVQATGTDVEGPLTWSVATQPMNGTATCHPTTGLCTYSPATNFFGNDSFVVRGTDTNGASATATFSVTVNPVNDAPVADDQSVTVTEDATNFPITLTASDVDNATLTFTAPVDDVDHGTLNCLGASCTYSPTPNYHGPDSFTFTATDGTLSSTGTVTITVTPVNDAPVATDVPDAVTDEDVTLPLTLGGTDVDGDPVTVTAVTDPPNGSATIQGPNAVDYLGHQNFHGIDTFDFTVTDGQGAFDTGTVVVTVRPVNDAPVVDDQTVPAVEDTPLIISMAAGDVDGDALTWSIVNPPAHGQLFGTGPDVGYSPHLNFNGTDSFVVRVSDGNGGADTALITIEVEAVNDQPVATADEITVAEDSSVTFSLQASDVDGDSLTFTAPVQGPSNGLALCSGGACQYTPSPNFHGSDLFTFSVDDGNGGTDSASVSITVTSVNDEPVAVDDEVTTAEDTSVTITLVATDDDADPLTYEVSAPTHGTLQGVAPDVVYIPATNFHGADSFDFTVSDGNGGTSTATISITVLSVNDAPIATGGTAVTPEDTPVSFQLGGSDVDGDPLTFTVPTPPADGSLACDAAGECSYTPAANFSGSVTIGYEATDGQASDSGVFTVLVDPVNDPPVAGDSFVTTPEDTPVTITLSATDTEGDPLTYSIVAPPAHGTLACSADNTSCVYTPTPHYHGADSFQWSADDGNSGQVTATVDIDVTPVNDAPQAVDTSATTDEEVPVDVPLLATDAEGDPITYTIVSGPSNGSIVVSGSTATYTPAVDFEGVDTFVYRATDPSGAFTEASGTVVVVGAPLIGTTLVADPATAYIRIRLGVPLNASVVLLRLSATLREVNGPPLAGRQLDFHIGSRFICSAATDANGSGTCSTIADGLAATLNLGYRVSFAGDPDHTGSTATGGLIGVFVTGFP